MAARFRAVFSNRAGSLASAAATLTVLTRATPLARRRCRRPTTRRPRTPWWLRHRSALRRGLIVADPVTRADGIRTSCHTRAGGWSAAVDVPTVDIDASRGLTAALGNDGTAVVTCVTCGRAAQRLVRAPGPRRRPGAARLLIENDDSVAVRGVKVVADANGTATAVWNTSAARTFASRLDAGSTAEWRSSSAAQRRQPHAGAGRCRRRRVLAAFEDFDRNNGQRVMVATATCPAAAGAALRC